MRIRASSGVLFLLALGLAAGAGHGQVAIRFGRYLATPDPLPVADGVYEVTLSIHAEQAWGELLWERSYPKIPIRSGSIEARFVGPPTDVDLSGAWLEILVDGQVFGGPAEIKAPEDICLRLAEDRLEFLGIDPGYSARIGYDGTGLNLVSFGGDVMIFTSAFGPAHERLRVYPDGRVRLAGGTNATLADGSGYLEIGFDDRPNLVFDDNEIQARNAGAAATLFLQHQGGEVRINNVVVQTSDRRKKRAIRDLELGLDDLLRLRPVSFEWKDHAGPRRPGLVAQEVREVIEEIVTEDDDGTLGLAYGSLIPVLVRSIQEQQDEIERLRSDLEALRVRFAGG